MPNRYSPKLKFQIVMELLQGDKTPGQVARAWKRTFLEKGSEVFSQKSAGAEYARRIAELEQWLSQKELEIALLKNCLGRVK